MHRHRRHRRRHEPLQLTHRRSPRRAPARSIHLHAELTRTAEFIGPLATPVVAHGPVNRRTARRVTVETPGAVSHPAFVASAPDRSPIGPDRPASRRPESSPAEPHRHHRRNTAPPLAPLAGLLADEPALRAVIAREPVVAVPDAARAVFLAALVGDDHPSAAPRRHAHRCRGRAARARPRPVRRPRAGRAVPGVGDPARSSGCRRRSRPWAAACRVLWRLRAGGEHLPTVVVATVRALVQRLGPHVEDVEPVVVRPGDRVDRDELVERLVAAGYRREYQVEARGEVAVRGSIVDVYPSTDDHPVRIDLWGDEVDRLSAFSVADQRTTHVTRRGVDLPDPRAAPDRRGARPGRASCCAPSRGAASSGSASPKASVFDGMESWLPWLTAGEHLLPDLLPDTALALLVEPKRMRDRAQELLDEEAALAATLAGTWGARSTTAMPRLSLAFDRLLAHTRAGAVSMLSSPEGPDTPHLPATAFDPVVGDTDALARRLRALADRRVPRRARGRGHRLRAAHARPARGRGPRRDTRRGGAQRGAPDRRAARARRDPAVGAARARRRSRPHRPPARAPPRPWRAQGRRLLRRRSRRATTSCTTSTASAATSR